MASRYSGGGPRLRVRARRVDGLPVVAVRAWALGGARAESRPGLALVAGRSLAEGSGRRGWKRVAEEAEGRGMGLSGFGAFEVTGVAADALAADWELALEWVAELLLEPRFPAERCDWIARQAAAELRSLADEPDVLTGWSFLRQLYHPHPRARPLHGDADSLAALEPDDLAAFHRSALARGVIVTVAGDVDVDAAATRVEQLFGALAGEGTATPEPPPAEGLDDRRCKVPLAGADQAHLFAGHRTLPQAHPDLPALDLLGVVLGSGPGLTGRIPQRIRDREGLTYSTWADAAAGAGLDPGRLVVYACTSVENVGRVERAVVEELRRLVEDGVTDEELEEARAYLVGREPFRRETARQWADLLAAAELYGLPLDQPAWLVEAWQSLSRAEVEAAARRHVDPERLRVTVGVPRG